jgi:hypothetical protein
VIIIDGSDDFLRVPAQLSDVRSAINVMKHVDFAAILIIIRIGGRRFLDSLKKAKVFWPQAWAAGALGRFDMLYLISLGGRKQIVQGVVRFFPV